MTNAHTTHQLHGWGTVGFERKKNKSGEQRRIMVTPYLVTKRKKETSIIARSF